LEAGCYKNTTGEARHVPRNVLRIFRGEEDEDEVVAKEKKTGNVYTFGPAAYEARVGLGAAHVIETQQGDAAAGGRDGSGSVVVRGPAFGALV
jgi:hypothetical protein